MEAIYPVIQALNEMSEDTLQKDHSLEYDILFYGIDAVLHFEIFRRLGESSRCTGALKT